MESKALFETLWEMLVEAEANRPGHTLGIVEAKALVDTLANTLPETKSKTLRNTLKDEAQVDTVQTLSET